MPRVAVYVPALRRTVPELFFGHHPVTTCHHAPPFGVLLALEGMDSGRFSHPATAGHLSPAISATLTTMALAAVPLDSMLARRLPVSSMMKRRRLAAVPRLDVASEGNSARSDMSTVSLSRSGALASTTDNAVTPVFTDTLQLGAMNANADRVLYSDTDGMVLEGLDAPTGIETDDNKLGAWKNDHTYTNLRILGNRKYCGVEQDGATVMRLSGVHRAAPIPYESFTAGSRHINDDGHVFVL